MTEAMYACKAVFPTFLILLTGAALKKRGLFTDDFISRGNRLCFQLLFPILVFMNLYEAEKIERSYGKWILMAYLIIAVSLSVLFFIVPRLMERKRASVLIQCAYRGNYMVYGLPFSYYLGGAESMVIATTIMAATQPVLNIIGVFIYSWFAEQEDGMDLRAAAVNALKNPIIWSVLAGLSCRGLEIPLPDPLYMVGKDLSEIVTPLAFLLLGGQFRLGSAVKNRKALAAGLLIKLVILPMSVLLVAIGVLDLTKSSLVPLFVFAAAPTAITNYQMAVQFDADMELAGDFLIYSMLFSVITMFLFVYILRTGHWI